jgi:ATP-dependent 26S proteasome regulatory subunit
MNVKRLTQLKSYGLKRIDLEKQIKEINNSLLKDKELKEIFREFVFSKMKDENFSLAYFNSLRYKIGKIKWVKIPTKESLYQVMYATMIQHILLPNYVHWWQKEDIVKEFEKLFQRSLHLLEKKIEIDFDKYYAVELWNIDELEEEINWMYSDDFYWVDFRDFAIGWPFWINVMGYNEEIKAYRMDIPIRLPIKITEMDHLDLQTIDIKTIEKVITKYFPKNLKESKKWPIESLKFDDFYIKIKKIQDKDTAYGIDPKHNYYVISVMNEKVSDLNPDRYSIDKIIETIQWFLKVNNFIVNEVIKEAGLRDFKKKIYAFSSWNMVLWHESDDSEVVSKETFNKFKKLLVKDDLQIHLQDVWWQEWAKAEIWKIITSIKNEEIMRSWWARTTSWIIFEWPAWTGKTLLAKVIATEVNAEVYNIKLTDIQSSAYINEWANNVKELFAFFRHQAKKTNKKVVVILDELDALFKKRQWRNQSAEDTKVVNTFLSEMSWFDDISNIIFIWTTNLIETLDEAVIRSWRMSTRVKVDLPDQKAREQIFDIHIKKVMKIWTKTSWSFQNIDIPLIAEKATYFSGADIAEVIRRIVEKKAIQEVSTGKIENIYNDEIISIIEEIKSQKRKNVDLLNDFDKDLIQKLDNKDIWEYYRQAIIHVIADKLRSEFNNWMW